MRIDIPASLTAEFQMWGREPGAEEYTNQEVVVSFGNYEVVRLAPLERVSWYSDDYDRDQMAQQTVAEWLSGKFNVVD